MTAMLWADAGLPGGSKLSESAAEPTENEIFGDECWDSQCFAMTSAIGDRHVLLVQMKSKT